MTRTAFMAGFVLVLAYLSAGAQDFLKKSFVVSGDPKPILLNADYVSTWTEGSQRIFLLRGTVWIEQGLIKLSMPESVVWVDENKKKTTGIYNLQVYGEGTVLVKDGSTNTSAGRVLLDMATRGEVRIKARANQVMQLALPEDPVYLRAKNERLIAQPTPVLPPPGPLGPSPGPTPPGPPPSNPLWNVPPVLPPGPGKGPPQPPSLGAPPPLANPPPLLNPPPVVKPPPLTKPPAGQPANPGLQQTGYQTESGSPESSSGFTPAVFQELGPPSPGPALGPPAPGPPVPVPANPAAPPPSIGPPPPPGNASGVTPPPPPPKLPPTGPVPERLFNLSPRSGTGFLPQIKRIPLPNGEFAWVVSNGVILTIRNPNDKVKMVDIEADQLVFWTKDDSQDLFNNMRGPGGESKASKSMEFYMSGNVEIRNEAKLETQIIRADEVYYDVSRNVAVALRGELEIHQKKLPYPMHIQSDVIIEVNPKLFKAGKTVLFASSLPSDPGLKVVVSESTLEELDTPRRNIFGLPIIDQKTGEPIKDPQRIFRGRNLLLELDSVPIFYFPYVQGDPADPLGPLDMLNFNYNRIFGFQFQMALNVYDLLGVTPTPGTRWRLETDYFSRRGPALGTTYEFAGRDMFFGIPGWYEGYVKAYGIYDTRFDILGFDRGQVITVTPPPNPLILPVSHPNWRGRFQARANIQDLPDWLTVQININAVSDLNFMEQYFNQEFQNDPFQQTFAYIKQQQNNWQWSVLVEDRTLRWFTETSWLPRGDAYLIGQKLFSLFTYDAHASAGYGRLQPTDVPPPAYLGTDANVNTARLDLWQTLSMPIPVGDLKLVPYITGDLAYYGDNINKVDVGRMIGGGGVRASLPLSRFFPDVQSDYFNLNGIYHKIVFSTNFVTLFSSQAMTSLPQMDRLNDDTSDQSLRQMFPLQSTLNPNNAFNLMFSNEFNPQFYALRRLLTTNVDTMDSIEVVQLDLRQRWQTLRGFPGNQHVVDWMTLDLGASIFPRDERDNFGQTFGILQYDWTWNIGDMTSLLSSGWMDPIGGGPRVFNIGANLMRPDRTNFYLGYRQIDPLQSKAVIANVSYAFSAKYAIAASTVYDFGIHNQVNTIALTRIGTDVMVSLGFSYNSLLNTFSVNFAIVPNVMGATYRGQTFGGPGMGGAGGMGGMPLGPMMPPVN
jgi:hypothetical protein